MKLSRLLSITSTSMPAGFLKYWEKFDRPYDENLDAGPSSYMLDKFQAAIVADIVDTYSPYDTDKEQLRAAATALGAMASDLLRIKEHLNTTFAGSAE